MWGVLKRDLSEFVNVVKTDTTDVVVSTVSKKGEEAEAKEDMRNEALRATLINSETYTVEGSSAEFDDFARAFEVNSKTAEISQLLAGDPVLTALHAELVPDSIPYAAFWAKYYFQIFKLSKPPKQQVTLVDEDEEEEFGWDQEDETPEARPEMGLKEKSGKEINIHADPAEDGARLPCKDGVTEEAAGSRERLSSLLEHHGYAVDESTILAIIAWKEFHLKKAQADFSAKMAQLLAKIDDGSKLRSQFDVQLSALKSQLDNATQLADEQSQLHKKASNDNLVLRKQISDMSVELNSLRAQKCGVNENTRAMLTPLKSPESEEDDNKDLAKDSKISGSIRDNAKGGSEEGPTKKNIGSVKGAEDANGNDTENAEDWEEWS